MPLTVRKIEVGDKKASLRIHSCGEFFGSIDEMGKLYNNDSNYNKHNGRLKLFGEDGEPKPEDVKQTRDGACYYLGTLRSMASTEKGRQFIKNMITVNDWEKTATVHFFARKNSEDTGEKIPYDVTVPLEHSCFDEYNDDTYQAGWMAVIQNAYFASLLWATGGCIPTEEQENKYFKGKYFDDIEFNYDSVFSEGDYDHSHPSYLAGSSPDAFISNVVKSKVVSNESGAEFQKKMIATHDMDEAAKMLTEQLITARDNGSAVSLIVKGPHVVSIENVSKDGTIKYHDQLHDIDGTFSVKELLQEKAYLKDGDGRKTECLSIDICSLKDASSKRVDFETVRNAIKTYFKPMEDDDQRKLFLERVKKQLQDKINGFNISEDNQEKVNEYLKQKLESMTENSWDNRLFKLFKSIMTEYGCGNMSEANINEMFDNRNYTMDSWLLNCLQKEISNDKTADKTIVKEISEEISNTLKAETTAPKNRDEKINALSKEKMPEKNIRRTPDQIADRIKYFLDPKEKQFKAYTENRVDFIIGLAKKAPNLYKEEANLTIKNRFMNAVTTNGRDISAGIPQLKVLMKYLRSEWNNSEKYDDIIDSLTKVEKYCTGKDTVYSDDHKLAILLNNVKEIADDYTSSKEKPDERSRCKVCAAEAAKDLVDEYLKEMNVSRRDIASWKIEEARKNDQHKPDYDDDMLFS